VTEAAQKDCTAECQRVLQNPDNVEQRIHAARRRMSDGAGALRKASALEALLQQTREELATLSETVGVASEKKLYRYFKLRDLLVTQCAVLTAMLDWCKTVGSTCGSSLYYDPEGEKPEGLEECFRFTKDAAVADKIQTVRMERGSFHAAWRPVRPIPQNDDFFENVWRSYRENGNVC
jgi:hypothetical protein